jgi:hypothetical protein
MPKRPMARALESGGSGYLPLCAGAQTLWFEKERDTGLAKPKVPLSFLHAQDKTQGSLCLSQNNFSTT